MSLTVNDPGVAVTALGVVVGWVISVERRLTRLGVIARTVDRVDKRTERIADRLGVQERRHHLAEGGS